MSKSSKIERVLYANGNHCYLAKSVGRRGVTRILVPRAMGQIMAASTVIGLTVEESMEVVADMVGGMKGCDYLEPGLYSCSYSASVLRTTKE